MGADIYGWVEVKHPNIGHEHWHAVVMIEDLVDRSPGMFRSLFGHRNHGEIRPIAKGRGLPPDASVEVKSACEDDGAVGTTWILWSEIAAIDWDEEETEMPLLDIDALYYTPAEPARRKDYLVEGWGTLFKIMEVLAAEYGPEGVRLSVWFDM